MYFKIVTHASCVLVVCNVCACWYAVIAFIFLIKLVIIWEDKSHTAKKNKCTEYLFTFTDFRCLVLRTRTRPICGKMSREHKICVHQSNRVVLHHRPPTNMADYKEAPLATRPKTLEPAEYFHVSPEYRRAEEERGALRSRLKREYQTKLNNPLRKELIVSAEGRTVG